MDQPELPQPIATLVDHLATLPNVVAVTLRGSRLKGTELADRDWDLGLYYHGEFDPQGISHVEGTATAPGDWGRIMNGGARLIVDGIEVDVHYRDVDEVRHWIREARDGRFEVDGVPGNLAGLPTYTLAAVVAQDQLLPAHSTTSLNTLIDSPKKAPPAGSTTPRPAWIMRAGRRRAATWPA